MLAETRFTLPLVPALRLMLPVVAELIVIAPLVEEAMTILALLVLPLVARVRSAVYVFVLISVDPPVKSTAMSLVVKFVSVPTEVIELEPVYAPPEASPNVVLWSAALVSSNRALPAVVKSNTAAVPAPVN